MNLTEDWTVTQNLISPSYLMCSLHEAPQYYRGRNHVGGPSTCLKRLGMMINCPTQVRIHRQSFSCSATIILGAIALMLLVVLCSGSREQEMLSASVVSQLLKQRAQAVMTHNCHLVTSRAKQRKFTQSFPSNLYH